MKPVVLFLLSIFFYTNAVAQADLLNTAKQDTTKKLQVVDAARGQCKFGLAGKDCDLAVRINGKAFFVEGTGIDEHGDAHAGDGFCNAIRKAEVQGKVVAGKFKATYFKLVKEPTKKE